MKTKEEVIKEAYGDMWSKLSPSQQKYALNNNGTITFPPSGYNGTPELLSDLWDYFSKNGDKLDDQDYGNNFMSYHTPMSLKGIGDNNGWIKVQEGLPKEDIIDCNIMLSNGHMCLNGGFRRYSNDTYYFFNQKGEGFNINAVTHYQPIVKPLKPLY